MWKLSLELDLTVVYSSFTNHTFSNLSLTGFGFIAVTVSTISLPILNACSLVAPFSNTNKLKKTIHVSSGYKAVLVISSHIKYKICRQKSKGEFC